MSNKVIINFTPTGMVTSKELNSSVPLSVDEIVGDVLSVSEFISMVHLHARDDMGKPTYVKDIYSNIISGIRKYNKDLILCVSTSGRGWSEDSKRSECLEMDGEVKPDMASLTLSSLNFNKEASVNSPSTIQFLANKMREKGIKPELEVFDIGMINYAKYLYKKGLFDSPFYFNLILGNIACAQANLLNLGLMINELPEDSYWSVGGVGDCQLKMNVMGILSGGGARVGLEDNVYFDDSREKLATNFSLVNRIKDIIVSLGMEIATPLEVRKMLGLERRNV